MKRLAYLFPALAFGFGLTACPGDDSPGVVSSTEGDTEDEDTTNGPTTTPTTVTVSTTDMPTTTDMPSTTDTPTSTDPTSSESGLPECTKDDECITADDCPIPGAACVGCLCVGGEGCEMYGAGAFGDCGNEGIAACMGAKGAGCFADPPGNPVVSVCVSSCTEACDCPQPPKGFEGQLACEDIFTGEGNECIISCDTDDECPDGWSCFAGTFCAHGELPELPGYGDCENLAGTCPPTMGGSAGGCVAFGPPMDESAFGGAVCTASPCEDADDCPDAPSGTAVVTCENITQGDEELDCFLDCAGGAECPEGMTCHAEAEICYWETLYLDPYSGCVGVVGTCPLGPDGQASDCLQTSEVSFCSHDCAMTADCLPPATGNAVPECVNIPMVGNSCVLPCEMGTTCPDGATCDAMLGLCVTEY